MKFSGKMYVKSMKNIFIFQTDSCMRSRKRVRINVSQSWVCRFDLNQNGTSTLLLLLLLLSTLRSRVVGIRHPWSLAVCLLSVVCCLSVVCLSVCLSVPKLLPDCLMDFHQTLQEVARDQYEGQSKRIFRFCALARAHARINRKLRYHNYTKSN